MADVITNGFSIVVCSYNGKERLAPTLVYIAALHIPKEMPVELIVVDNASIDGTYAFVESAWKNLKAPFPLNLLQDHRTGKGYAIETGYDAAKYSYIVTVDDDNWLNNDYLVNAYKILNADSRIGVLQGKSIGIYEMPPPEWIKDFESYFVVGGPLEEPGFFPKHNIYVRGAGMIILNADWRCLRQHGFSILTSKTSGKTAGEDNETAIGILLLGKRIYYSDKLIFRHFMPKERIKWSTLEGNFAAFGVGSYYFYMYHSILDSIQNDYDLTTSLFKRRFLKMWLREVRQCGMVKNLSYISSGNKKYRLELKSTYYKLKAFLYSLKNLEKDLPFLKSWITSVISNRSDLLPLSDIM